jgi:integrase
MSLTDSTCKNAKPLEKPYKLSDGRGLYLLVHPNGSKYWRLKYRLHGKEKLKAIGVYPEISLAAARDVREHDRKLLAAGMDPMGHKRETQRLAKISATNTFEIVAREWHDLNKDRWSRSYPAKILRFLEKDIFPVIGSRPISDITPPELLECLRRIEKRGALDIAGKTKQVCGQIFRFGIQTGKCERDPSADLKGALKTRKTTHYRTIDDTDISNLLIALDKNAARLFPRTLRAIRFSLLTFARPGEIRQACWSEINWKEKLWVIPAEKMKMRREHIVPLSDQSIALLQEQKEESGYLKTDYIFPSQIRPMKPMSDGTVTRALDRLGYGEMMVAHGFRALARTTIREKLGYDAEIIEKQLAHKTKNALGEAYDRTQFLSDRKKMMQGWAEYLDAAAKSVVSLAA